MREQGYPGGCRNCRVVGLQGSCLHHEVTTTDSYNAQIERYSIPLSSLPVLRKYVERYAEHLARVSDMQSTFNPSALGSIAKCEGSYVNEGVEAFQRMRGYRVDMFSRTL
jgi:hypothetical protein